MLFVVDVEAARTALHAGALACPVAGCPGRLHPWGVARPRTVWARVGHRVRLVPDRARCGTCRAGQTLLPAWYCPARSAGSPLLGAALTRHLIDGHGQAQVAADLGLPASTVRGWLAGTRQHAAGALTRLVAWIGRDLATWPPTALWRRHDPTPEPAQALADLTQAALAWLRPDPPHQPTPTGVDYLHLVARQHRRGTNRRLRLVDPTDARPQLGLWPAINVLAGGRLLDLLSTPG